MSEYVVELKRISKRFGTVQANDSIDLRVRKGAIHALLGENGSGKTTLMNILFGLVRMDSGEILIRGEHAAIDSPLAALRRGVGMIHQEFMLIPQLTVGENIMIGVLEKDRTATLKNVLKKGEAFAKSFDLWTKLNLPVQELSLGERQKVEIVKTLYQGAEIIILDEPTSVLTPQEAGEMFKILGDLTLMGKTIILITHKLEEVLQNTSEVTVLRAGKSVETLRTVDTNKFGLAEKMIGRRMLFSLREKQSRPGAACVVAEHLSLKADSGVRRLDDVSFTIRKGEILGVAGVDGNGQTELSEVLSGVRKPDKGAYSIDGAAVTRFQARALADAGVSFIPGERSDYGCATALPIEKNLILKTYNAGAFCSRGFMRWASVKRSAEERIGTYQIKTSGSGERAGSLSGGNLQKVILARELSSAPKFLICVQPTRGLDIGAVEYVQNCLLEAREKGVSILLISTELDEILALSDRIAVISRGRIVDIVENGPDVDTGRIGLLMAGGAIRLEEGAGI